MSNLASTDEGNAPHSYTLLQNRDEFLGLRIAGMLAYMG